MSTLELADTAHATPPTSTEPASEGRTHPIGALAGFVGKAGNGDKAALARLDPQGLRPHQMAALSRGLLHAGLSPEQWRPVTWQRWALIAHGMALAGHDAKGRLGEQLARAGVSESRLTRLLTARGDAFVQGLPPLLRLLGSKAIAPNWYELGRLILKEASPDPEDREDAEALRLRIAGAYFSAVAHH
jgi:CRISPR system Cascade subunit CasB